MHGDTGAKSETGAGRLFQSMHRVPPARRVEAIELLFKNTMMQSMQSHERSEKEPVSEGGAHMKDSP